MVGYNADTYDTATNCQLHGVASVFDIKTPKDEDMESLPIYEVMG